MLVLVVVFFEGWLGGSQIWALVGCIFGGLVGLETRVEARPFFGLSLRSSLPWGFPHGWVQREKGNHHLSKENNKTPIPKSPCRFLGHLPLKPHLVQGKHKFRPYPGGISGWPGAATRATIVLVESLRRFCSGLQRRSVEEARSGPQGRGAGGIRGV